MESKPLLRGYAHAVAAFFALAGLISLVIMTAGDPPKQLSMMVYGGGLVLLFTVSALYHIGNWSPRLGTFLRRWDHANIFLLIAATYTPVVFNVLTGGWRIGILVGIWTLAVIGIVGLAPALHVPPPVHASMYVLMGWVVLGSIPQFASRMDIRPMLLMAAGGIQYSLGALVYALRRPRLWPRVFSYHEVFHVAVITASLTFYIVIVLYVVPYPRA